MEFALQSLTNSWIEKHPLVFWLLQHPVISLTSLFILTVLLFRLFSALAQLLDKLWIWLLKLPILLIKFLLSLRGKTLKTASINSDGELKLGTEKMGKIIEKLELIERQQQQIIRELAALKQEKDSSIVF